MGRLKDQIGNDQCDRAVQDVNGIRILDSTSTTLAEIEGITWNAASVTGDNAIAGVSNAPREANAVATGTAASAEFYDSVGVTVEVSDLSVGTSGSGADVILSSTSLTSGEPVRLNSASHEVPLILQA